MSTIAPEDKLKEDALQKALRDQLGAGLSRQQLEDLAKQAHRLQKRLALHGPRTDDELHAWIKQKIKVDIPRVAVCLEEGHRAPFDFVADAYFERTTAAVLMANRGGSKTFMVALLHMLNSKFKPKTESATVGAIEMQARRAYMHLGKLIDELGPEAEVDSRARTQIETKWRNGSRVEILAGTMSAVNGPHPSKLHLDEAELMDPEVFDEAMNMPQSMEVDGRMVEAQVLITSTRKRAAGMMASLVKGIEESKRAGSRPAYDLYVHCIYETAKNVPNCQVANPACDDPCPCDNVVKGSWENGNPRTLKDCCGGRLAKSDGWIPFSDVTRTFQHVSRGVWEAQQECRRPETQGLVVPGFTRDRHGVRNWDPRPEYGPIFMSIDFGGSNPHAVNWYQVLFNDMDVTHPFRDNQKKRIPAGSAVCFDEYYRADVGNVAVAKAIVGRESHWRRRHSGFRTALRFYDPQAAAARRDFAAHETPLRLKYYAGSKDVKEQIKLVNEYVEGGTDGLPRLFVDMERCPNFCDEMEAWHYPKRRQGMLDDPEKPVEDYDHCMAELRYFLDNIRAIKRKATRSKTDSKPTSIQRKRVIEKPTASNPARRTENWRKELGGPG